MTIPYNVDPSPISPGDTLLVALFLASLVHVALLLGLNFSFPKPPRTDHSIEVTFSSTPTQKAPKKAKFLSQSHQKGGGEKTQKPKPAKQRLFSAKQGQKQRVVEQKIEQKKTAPAKKIVTAKQAETDMTTSTQPEVVPTTETSSPQPKLTAAALYRQIAQLGEQIRQTKRASEFNKIKFVNQVSTHKYVAAQYMRDWENKVERTGNMNYPEVARKKNFYGTLTMDVGIKADGSIFSMRITQSSGNQALDDAAKRIVRLSAPFAELPAELLEELDVLIITRVWKFSDQSGMTTR